MEKLFSYWFNLLGGINLLLNYSYNIITLNDILVQKKIPSFYVEILKVWEMI